MKAIVQRTKSAKVTVNGHVVGMIDNGMLVLVGIKKGDNSKSVITLANKIVRLRIFSEENEKMNYDLKKVNGSILLVSQFTLHADTSKGNRPSFVQAEDPNIAEALYNELVSKMRSLGAIVQTGAFGQHMQIEAELDGPVTIIVET